MIVNCINEYRLPVFEDLVFEKDKVYNILDMTDTPEGSIDIIILDKHGEKWGFVLNNGDESDDMYVYSSRKNKGYIGTGKLFNNHFKKITNI